MLRSGGHALIAPPAAPGTNAMGHRRTRELCRGLLRCREPREPWEPFRGSGSHPKTFIPPNPQPRGYPEATSLLCLNLPQANSGLPKPRPWGGQQRAQVHFPQRVAVGARNLALWLTATRATVFRTSGLVRCRSLVEGFQNVAQRLKNGQPHRQAAMFFLVQGYIYTLPSPPSCPPPPYTTTHSAGHPTLFTFTPPVHLLPILSLPQMDTLPSQCELRLLRLQQRQRRVLERGRWLFPRPPNQVPR